MEKKIGKKYEKNRKKYNSYFKCNVPIDENNLRDISSKFNNLNHNNNNNIIINNKIINNINDNIHSNSDLDTSSEDEIPNNNNGFHDMSW